MERNTEDASGSISPFRIGFLSTLLAFAGLTAASWFFRSESWGNLCGYTQNFSGEALGFPFEFWRINKTYHGGWLLNFPVLAVNVGIMIATATGLTFFLKRSIVWLQQKVTPHQRKHRSQEQNKGTGTFSLRGLLFITTVLAVAIAAIQRLGPSPQLLATIVFGGPAFLLGIAMFPKRLSWEQRSWIIVGTSGILMAAAIVVGNRLEMPFDRVLFSIFISWVPQSVAGAALVTLSLLLSTPRSEVTS